MPSRHGLKGTRPKALYVALQGKKTGPRCEEPNLARRACWLHGCCYIHCTLKTCSFLWLLLIWFHIYVYITIIQSIAFDLALRIQRLKTASWSYMVEGLSREDTEAICAKIAEKRQLWKAKLEEIYKANEAAADPLTERTIEKQAGLASWKAA